MIDHRHAYDCGCRWCDPRVATVRWDATRVEGWAGWVVVVGRQGNWYPVEPEELPEGLGADGIEALADQLWREFDVDRIEVTSADWETCVTTGEGEHSWIVRAVA